MHVEAKGSVTLDRADYRGSGNNGSPAGKPEKLSLICNKGIHSWHIGRLGGNGRLLIVLYVDFNGQHSLTFLTLLSV